MLLRESALPVIAGHLADAAEYVRRIDAAGLEAMRQAAYQGVSERLSPAAKVIKALRGQKGRGVSRATRRAVSARDNYTCRYRHCGRRTVDDQVLRLLSKALPKALPYHSHWKLGHVHPVDWTHTASLEHALAWSRQGASVSRLSG
jgi:hypothetical protein